MRREQQPRVAAFRSGEGTGHARARLVFTGQAGARVEQPGSGRSFMPVAPAASPEQAEDFPPLPTLLATRLQLELLLADQPVDLRAAAGILMNDLGATLEIFRRAGEECGGGPDVPERLEDCLASLDTDVWMEAVCAGAVERMAVDEAALAELTGFWEHGRLLAYACWFVAEQMEGVCPEEAFLVGLLHEAARLPEILGWMTEPDCEPAYERVCEPAYERVYGTDAVAQGGIALEPRRCPASTARQLAAHWRLPVYLGPVLAGNAVPQRWQEVLERAHAWSSGEDCLLTHIA